MIIGIIGGGASGMAAALAAAENTDNTVVLFERQARLGKKLLATGNGRCNLSNRNLSAQAYHGEDVSFAMPALKAFCVDDTLAWFESMGLLTVSEKSGRVYPYSDQANSVLDVLRFALDEKKVVQKLGFEVVKVRKADDKFIVESREEKCVHWHIHDPVTDAVSKNIFMRFIGKTGFGLFYRTETAEDIVVHFVGGIFHI